MIRKSSLLFLMSSVIIIAAGRPSRADSVIDHFGGDSLKAYWTVSGSTGTYSVSGGALHVSYITPELAWSDMFLTAPFIAQDDFTVALGFDYPYAVYKRMALVLLDQQGSASAHLMMEDSPSNWLVFRVGECYQQVSRPTMPSWIRVTRTGGVLTAEWQGYSPLSCALTDTIAAVQILFSRWGTQPFNGFSVDSIVATSVNAPSVTGITLDGSVQVGHVLDHSPLISWTYFDLDGDPQLLTEVQVGSDTNWTNGAEMWNVQAPGAATDLPYGGQNLVDGTDYWLRVRAFDGLLWGNWTGLVFHMNAPPSTPTQLAPNVLMEATVNPSRYTAIVNTDAEGDLQRLQYAVIMDDSIVVDQSPLVPVAPATQGDTVSWTGLVHLMENGSYIWVVRSTDGYDTTGYWSAWEPFVVNAVQEAPFAPTLTLPLLDSVVYAEYPSFLWHRAMDPDPNDTVCYQYQGALNSIFCDALVIDSIKDTSLTLFTPLELGTRYWWRVLSQDNHGFQTTSLAAQCRVYVPGDVNRSLSVTSADIITLVNYVFKGQPLTVPECAGRCNGDGIVTSSDIIYLVNMVFKGGPEPVAGCG